MAVPTELAQLDGFKVYGFMFGSTRRLNQQWFWFKKSQKMGAKAKSLIQQTGRARDQTRDPWVQGDHYTKVALEA